MCFQPDRSRRLLTSKVPGFVWTSSSLRGGSSTQPICRHSMIFRHVVFGIRRLTTISCNSSNLKSLRQLKPRDCWCNWYGPCVIDDHTAKEGGENMKIATSILAAVLFTGTLGALNNAIAEDGFSRRISLPQAVTVTRGFRRSARAL